MFLLYKNFISSQDASRCNFTPSCSEYALEAIKSRGLLAGPLAAFDRLSRCTSVNQEDYTRHPETGMLYDPVDPAEERLPLPR
ncbi:MAG: membrane protein insertion efficiency factor YidD [Bacteroidetes bacterium]|nr:MAG: membrane protein insertion efficiency factor YidD [Bacteroidota bacterium]